MLINISDYIFIAECISIHQLTGAAPTGVHIHKDLFWVIGLCSYGLIQRQPMELVLGQGTNKEQHRKKGWA